MTSTAPVSSRKPDRVAIVCLALSLACGAIYLVTRGLPDFTGSIAIKGLSVGPLAALAFRKLKSRDGITLGISLLFSTLGDLFLAINGEQMFTFGLASFLIAHLLYITLFVRNRPKPMNQVAGRQMLAALLAIFCAAMFAWLWPSLGDMRIPVAAYLCAITGMGITAALAGFRAWWVVAGAMLFIISDSMIAINRFKSPIERSDYLIWATYYAGQLFITLGFIREKNRLWN